MDHMVINCVIAMFPWINELMEDKPYTNSKILNQKSGSSIRMCEIIRVPPWGIGGVLETYLNHIEMAKNAGASGPSDPLEPHNQGLALDPSFIFAPPLTRNLGSAPKLVVPMISTCQRFTLFYNEIFL